MNCTARSYYGKPGWLEQYVKTLGYESMNEALEALHTDPDNPEWLRAWP